MEEIDVDRFNGKGKTRESRHRRMNGEERHKTKEKINYGDEIGCKPKGRLKMEEIGEG